MKALERKLNEIETSLEQHRSNIDVFGIAVKQSCQLALALSSGNNQAGSVELF